MKKLYVFILLLFSCYSAQSQCCSNGINLLANYNPDFSAPFTDIPPGFITANPYTFFPTPGTYIIVPSRNYGACFNTPQTDHTTGDPINGRFLWFDASSTASPATPDLAWQPFDPTLPTGTESLISVTPNTTYVFSCWIRDLARDPNCITGGAPLMGLRINGQEMAEIDLALITEPCCPQWTYLCTEWNSGDTTTALIQIESRRADGFNDLGIDDVYFGTTTEALQFSLGADTTVCEGTTLVISDNIENSTNFWSNFSSGDTIQVTSPGIYWLEVTKNNCKARDSIIVTQDSLPAIVLGADTTLCDQAPLLLSPFSTGGTISDYLWQNNSSANSITVNTSGNYWLQASNSCGTSSDSILVVYFIPPALDDSLNACVGDTVTLVAGFASDYQWSNGETTSSININNSGIYSVLTTLEQCLGSDTVVVFFSEFPVIELGNDTSICEDQSVVLQAESAENYFWSNDSITPSIIASNSGVYWVQASNGVCITTDTITINSIAYPNIELGSDTTICFGNSLTLNPGFAETYSWSDSSSFPSIVVSSEGLYGLQASNANCVTTDSIKVAFVNCDCEFIVEIPNSFTPNNDGFNDSFRPKKLDCISNATMTIFNRWGNEIFFTNDVQTGWDGTSNNRNSPDGTYYWILNYATTEKEKNEKAGFVTIVR